MKENFQHLVGFLFGEIRKRVYHEFLNIVATSESADEQAIKTAFGILMIPGIDSRSMSEEDLEAIRTKEESNLEKCLPREPIATTTRELLADEEISQRSTFLP